MVFAPSYNRTVQTVPSFGGLYFDSGSNGMYSVSMPSLDTYLIQVEVQYNQWVNQTVVISFLSSNQTISLNSFQINWPINSMGFNLYLTITTAVFPSIPTAQEIAAVQNSMLQAQINNMTAHYEASSATQSSWSELGIVFGVIGTFGAIGLCTLFFRERAKRIELAEQVKIERGIEG